MESFVRVVSMPWGEWQRSPPALWWKEETNIVLGNSRDILFECFSFVFYVTPTFLSIHWFPWLLPNQRQHLVNEPAWPPNCLCWLQPLWKTLEVSRRQACLNQVVVSPVGEEEWALSQQLVAFIWLTKVNNTISVLDILAYLWSRAAETSEA